MIYFQVPADPVRIGDTVIFELAAVISETKRSVFGYIVSLIDAPDKPVGGLQLKSKHEHWLVDANLDGAGLNTLMQDASGVTLRIAAGGSWAVMEPSVAALIQSHVFQFYDIAELSPADWTDSKTTPPKRPPPTLAYEGTDIDGTTPIRLLFSPDVNGNRALGQVVWESDVNTVSRYFEDKPLIGSTISLAAKAPLPPTLAYHHTAS